MVTVLTVGPPEQPTEAESSEKQCSSSKSGVCCSKKNKILSQKQLKGKEIYGCKTAASQQLSGKPVDLEFRILEENYKLSCENCR